MNKKTGLAIVAIVFLVAAFAAIVFDSKRLRDAKMRAVIQSDFELRTIEQRTFVALAGSPADNDATKSLIEKYNTAKTPEERRTAFDEVVVAVKRSAPIDSHDPLQRRFADELAGSLNRWTIAKKHYDEVMFDCREYGESGRGKLVQMVLAGPSVCR